MDSNIPETAEQKKRRWRSTEVMAWIAFVVACLFPLLVICSDSNHLVQISTPFYGTMIAIIGFYIGFSTIEPKWIR